MNYLREFSGRNKQLFYASLKFTFGFYQHVLNKHPMLRLVLQYFLQYHSTFYESSISLLWVNLYHNFGFNHYIDILQQDNN